MNILGLHHSPCFLHNMRYKLANRVSYWWTLKSTLYFSHIFCGWYGPCIGNFLDESKIFLYSPQFVLWSFIGECFFVAYNIKVCWFETFWHSYFSILLHFRRYFPNFIPCLFIKVSTFHLVLCIAMRSPLPFKRVVSHQINFLIILTKYQLIPHL